MKLLTRLVWLGFIFFGAHFFHIKSIGTENLILGCISDQFKYPPKSVFWWFADKFENFEVKPDHINPLHFAFNECIQTAPVSYDCLKMFSLMESKNVNFDGPSNIAYQFPILYSALLRCSEDGVNLALSLGANLEARPGLPPYDTVSPYQFLYSTSCDNKTRIKALLDGKIPLKYTNRPIFGGTRKVNWHKSDHFKVNKNWME